MNFKLVIISVLLISCSKHINRRTYPEIEKEFLRASAEIDLSNKEGFFAHERPFIVTKYVAENVKFVVSDENFSAPPILENLTSFGFLDITVLFDNNLKVCDGKKCKNALLKIFTRADGCGFWSAENNYGAPIYANNEMVEEEPGKKVFGINIENLRTVKLSDFTSNKTLPILISIDFSDAPVGNYSTVLVVQYILTL